MSRDTELLVGLSEDELEALADGRLAPASQSRIDELRERNAESQLSSDEAVELDRLIRQIDNLTVLKTRARYTLRQQAEAAGS